MFTIHQFDILLKNIAIIVLHIDKLNLFYVIIQDVIGRSRESGALCFLQNRSSRCPFVRDGMVNKYY